MINYSLMQTYDKVQESDLFVPSTLVSLEDDSVMFTFLWNPIGYTYTANNEFKNKYALFGTRPHTRFQNSNVGTIDLDKIEYHSPCGDRDFTTVIKQLEAIRIPRSDSLFPDRLAWVTGQKSIQPLMLKSFTFNRIEVLDGSATVASITMSFIGSEQVEFT